jgi:hypothetical protein
MVRFGVGGVEPPNSVLIAFSAREIEAQNTTLDTKLYLRKESSS